MGVTLIERLAQRVVESDTPLTRADVAAAVELLLPIEAPLAPDGIVTDVVDRLVGLGPLESLLRDACVTDVLVNSPDEVWIERDGLLEPTDVSFTNSGAVVAAVERAIAPLGLRLDLASPAVDARLPDGSRLHASIPPISVDGPVVAIRRFTQQVASLEEFVTAGSVSPEGARLLAAAVEERRNIVVSGATGAGKTTLLNLLSTEIPSTERVVTVEDAAELQLTGHVVRLEARPPNVEGRGEIPLRDLVRHALRLRPDRIIVGEVRGPEALDMIAGLSTGHAGSMSTVHASSPPDVLWRLETLALSGTESLPTKAVRRMLRSAIDLVVHLERTSDGRRVVGAVAEIDDRSVREVYRC
ncbi:MAG: CpaF family protein [Acidimicrobiia bacterium]